MDLKGIKSLTLRFPLCIHGNPLCLLYLPEDVSVTIGGEKVVRALDSLKMVEPQRIIIYEPHERARQRFPTGHLRFNPMMPILNDILFDKINSLPSGIRTQNHIGDFISRRARAMHPDVVVLLVVDGLSYEEAGVFSSDRVLPIIVRGPSTTSYGMRSTVGDPPVVELLAAAGYFRRRGYTYWERKNNWLTDELFTGFGLEVRKCESFSDIIDDLLRSLCVHTFVQIISSGLDQFAHFWRDEPLLQASLQRIRERFDQLSEAIHRRGLRGHLYLTSDHGILWKHQDHLRIVSLPHQEDVKVHARYVEGFTSTAAYKQVQINDGYYGLLRYPYISRKLSSVEWGVHGGVSVSESIVPLVVRDV
jgi:hypothetical protein